MVYGFSIRETAEGKVYVRANNPDEAQKIFTQWMNRVDDDPEDSTIEDLLDNGYEGREIVRSVGMTEEALEKMDPYWQASIMLPEEAPEPQEPRFHFHVRFADGNRELDYSSITLYTVGVELANLGMKYYLFPDPEPYFTNCDEKVIRIYAVLKDKEETYYTFTDKEHIYDERE